VEDSAKHGWVSLDLSLEIVRDLFRVGGGFGYCIKMAAPHPNADLRIRLDVVEPIG
jgi:hypothetical protein